MHIQIIFFKGKYIINEDQVPAQDRQRPVREGTKPRRRIQTVTARAFGDPGTITSRSSPTPFTIGVFAFRGNRTHVPGDKYMFNPFPLPIGESHLHEVSFLGTLSLLVVRLNW
ncbi:hypothetical protein QL285_058549 [Trifolium repens]|nr:hypothetical protein QL285_058549 [Trifolium repens]